MSNDKKTEPEMIEDEDLKDVQGGTPGRVPGTSKIGGVVDHKSDDVVDHKSDDITFRKI